MGSANFRGCGRFGLWAAIPSYNEEFYAQEYPELTEEERQAIALESENDWLWSVAKEAERAVDDLNDTLIFHRLAVKSGYYEGVEIVLDDIRYVRSCSSYPSAMPYDNDEELQWYVEEALGTGWYHDENSAKPKHLRRVRAMYDAECRRIAEWLLDRAMEMGFSPMYHSVGMGWDISAPMDRLPTVQEIVGRTGEAR